MVEILDIEIKNNNETIFRLFRTDNNYAILQLLSIDNKSYRIIGITTNVNDNKAIIDTELIHEK
jgi:hypothetical protein